VQLTFLAFDFLDQEKLSEYGHTYNLTTGGFGNNPTNRAFVWR
jgi:hypothetical protein